MLETTKDFDGYQGILDYLAENFHHDSHDNEKVSAKINERGACALLTFDGRLVTIERQHPDKTKFTMWVFSADDEDATYYRESYPRYTKTRIIGG